jgi:hypothetical protein
MNIVASATDVPCCFNKERGGNVLNGAAIHLASAIPAFESRQAAAPSRFLNAQFRSGVVAGAGRARSAFYEKLVNHEAWRSARPTIGREVFFR